MNTPTMNPTNLAGVDPCRDVALRLHDGCMFEPINLITFPSIDPAKIVAPVTVAANEAALITNKINVVDNTVVTTVLFPAAPAEKDIFVLVNQNPAAVMLKNAVADVTAVATLRGGSSASFRFVGGKWSAY